MHNMGNLEEGDVFDELQLAKDIHAILDHVEEKNVDRDQLIYLIKKHHYSITAHAIQALSSDKRKIVFRVCQNDFDPHILDILETSVILQMINVIGMYKFTSLLGQLEENVIISILEDIPGNHVTIIISLLPVNKQKLIENALTLYEEDTAGRLMNYRYVAIEENQTIATAKKIVRESKDKLPRHFHNVFIVNKYYQVQGSMEISQLLILDDDHLIRNYMDDSFVTINVNTPQEEVANIFRSRELISATVVDEDNYILGLIHVDDILNVIDDESEKDMLLIAGVDSSDLNQPVLSIVNSRARWLLLNMCTAFLSVAVINSFSDVIAKVVVLAALMPIVTSLGGSVGTQVLTVAIRALATNELTAMNFWSVCGKEMLVGLAQGIILAVAVGLSAAYLYDHLELQYVAVLSVAILINFIMASLGGFCVPVVLEKFNIDPALASGVIVTTITDVTGFMAFLGITSMVIKYLNL